MLCNFWKKYKYLYCFMCEENVKLCKDSGTFRAGNSSCTLPHSMDALFALRGLCEENHRSPLDSPHEESFSVIRVWCKLDQGVDQIIEWPVIWDEMAVIRRHGNVEICMLLVTHWGREKMAAISQTTLPNAFSWMKILEFWLNFHWSLFLWFQFTIFQHWFW